MAAPQLRLRPLRIEDEADALAAHAALATEGFSFLLGHREREPWADFLALTERRRTSEDTGDGWVPATFLAAVADGELVGRISIRHRLNDWLAAYGGHIGYAVVPAQRRRGYATEMLRQGLVVARAVGIENALLVCDARNVGSARVIEACGGEFESVVESDGGSLRRYWANVA